MKKVVSKNINTIHYEPKSKILEVSFNDGTTYHYNNVSQESYNAFENAKSHGKHFIKHIKDKHVGKKK